MVKVVTILACVRARVRVLHAGSNRCHQQQRRKMDDRNERKAALDALCNHYSDIAAACKENVDVLNAFEDFDIIDEEEKEDANDTEDYSSVIEKLQEKVNGDPNFFVEFFRHIQSKADLHDLGKTLLGECTHLHPPCSSIIIIVHNNIIILLKGEDLDLFV